MITSPTDSRKRDVELIKIINIAIQELRNNYWARVNTDNEWAMNYINTPENIITELTRIELILISYTER